MYESSAHVDVGGDVYDFLTLDDGRLAVVLGDVTGHGVEATADMAMAKFVFRSLAREHPEPGDFLASANDVVVDEIAPGKFITMAYLAVDGVNGTVSCASAGHPHPRLLLPDGSVRGLEASGLVLGIDAGQEYEAVHADLPPGAVLVVYTDGVIEARRDGELYGVERLDALLAANRDLGAAPARGRRHGELPELRGRRPRRRRRGRRDPPHRVTPLDLRRRERGIVRVGHRGAAALAPENSLAAIEAGGRRRSRRSRARRAPARRRAARARARPRASRPARRHSTMPSRSSSGSGSRCRST